jgi:type I restriction enzyme M protein
MDAAEYKHVVLGLIFLKYISDAFEEKHAALAAERRRAPTPRTPTSTAPTTSSGCRRRRAGRTCRPREAADHRQADRRRHGRHRARQPDAEGRAAEGLRPPRARQAAPRRADRPDRHDRPRRQGEPLARRARPRLRVLPHQFAAAEGKKGGQFYTPQCVVACSSRCSRPTRAASSTRAAARAACSSQSEKFVEAHGGRIGDVSIYGQESNHTTWRLAKLNLAIRGIDANIAWNEADTFHQTRHKDLKADYVIANPPFNDSDWGGDAPARRRALEVWRAARRQRELRLGAALPAPPRADRHRGLRAGQRQHVVAAVRRGRDPQGDRRGRPRRLHGGPARAALLLDADPGVPVVPGARQEERPRRRGKRMRNRSGETLFIDARKLGSMVDRVHRELTDDDIAKHHRDLPRWRGDGGGQVRGRRRVLQERDDRRDQRRTSTC